MTPEITREFAFAKAEGWLSAFIAAGRDYAWPPALLMAIASRETNMRNIIGDGGHGFGLMQIDVRSYPDFCHSGAWRNPILGIHTGAQVLDQKRTMIEHGVGASLSVAGYRFIGDPLAPGQLERVAVAAYNCGLWSYYAFSRGLDPDRFTTGRNYSVDVLNRMEQFDELLMRSQSGSGTPSLG